MPVLVVLAVQNMEASGKLVRDKDNDIEFSALEGSLSMMSKVLNDVLDLYVFLLLSLALSTRKSLYPPPPHLLFFVVISHLTSFTATAWTLANSNQSQSPTHSTL